MDNTRHLVITDGSHGQEFAIASGLPCLLLDTKEGVLSMGSERIETVHKVPDERVALPPDVPTRHQPQSGPLGAAYDSSYGVRCALSHRDHIVLLFTMRMAGVERVTVISSSGGGTGTGGFEPLVSEIRKVNFPGWIVFVHHIDPAVHPEKQTQRAYALACLGTGRDKEIHFLARTEKDVREILALRTEVLEEMAAIAANIPGARTEKSMRLIQFARLEIDNEAYAEAIYDHVLHRGLRNRFESGRKGLLEEEQERMVSRITRQLSDLDFTLRHQNGQFSSMRAPVTRRKDARIYRSRASQLVQDVTAKTERDVISSIAEITPLVSQIGLRAVERSITEMIQAYEAHATELAGTLQEHSPDRIMAGHIRQSLSIWSRIRRLVGLGENGSGAIVERVLNLNHRYVSHRIAADGLRSLVDRHQVATNGLSHPLPLPAGASYAELVDLYYAADDPNSGERKVRQRIRETLPELMVEGLVKEIRNHLRLGFDTSSNVHHNKGIIITGPDAERSVPVVDSYFVPKEYTTVLPPRSPRVTEIYLFQLINRWTDVPVLRHMIADVEARYANDDDRRLFICRAGHAWPVPLREEPGYEAELAARLLVMAYEVPGLLRILRQKGNQVELDYGGERRHYPSFSAFCGTLTYHQACLINQRFYRDHFGPDRAGCQKGLHDRAEGIEHKQNAKRLEGLQRFVGLKRWQAAIARLTHEVHIVDGFFE